MSAKESNLEYLVIIDGQIVFLSNELNDVHDYVIDARAGAIYGRLCDDFRIVAAHTLPDSESDRKTA